MVPSDPQDLLFAHHDTQQPADKHMKNVHIVRHGSFYTTATILKIHIILKHHFTTLNRIAKI